MANDSTRPSAKWRTVLKRQDAPIRRSRAVRPRSTTVGGNEREVIPGSAGGWPPAGHGRASRLVLALPSARILPLPERWMSGLSRTPGKRVWDNIPPRVRIPLSPPGHRLQTVCTKNEHPAQRLVLRGFSCKPPDFAYPTNVISALLMANSLETS